MVASVRFIIADPRFLTCSANIFMLNPTISRGPRARIGPGRATSESSAGEPLKRPEPPSIGRVVVQFLPPDRDSRGRWAGKRKSMSGPRVLEG